MTASSSGSGGRPEHPLGWIGRTIGGDFVVREARAEGGMGSVWVAEQRSTGKLRAVKVMHREIVADAALKKRFEQEAKVGARIPSEHVVEVVAAGVDEPTGLPYLVMELLEGEDLRQRLEARGALPLEEVRAVFDQLCHAMGAAHEAGVVHRDIKPENVFLARARRVGTAAFMVKVLDFGIAKLAAEAGTRATRGTVGSPLWMAPEQTSPGPVTPAADVWALGLLAYELVTGKPFWRAPNTSGGTTAQLLREIVIDPIPLASTRAAEQGTASRLPPWFDGWLARCLERDPEARFANAAQLGAAMTASFEGHAPPPDVMAATLAGSGTGMEASRLAETGAPTAFAPPARSSAVRTPDGRVVVSSAPPAAAASAPPPRVSLVPHETPTTSVREAGAGLAGPSPAGAPVGPNRTPLLAAVVLSVGAVATAWMLTRNGPAAPVPPAPAVVAPSASAAPVVAAPSSVAVGLAPSAASAPPPAAASDPPPAVVSTHVAKVASTPSTPSALAASPPSVARVAASAATPTPAPARSTGTSGGFGDPADQSRVANPGSPTQLKVGDRMVRLQMRLVSNESNVRDAVVRKAIEWSAWEFLTCYQRTGAGLKELFEGTVVVGYDILDQLPRHAALVSSTIPSKAFNDCVVGTLVGRTINEAGPDGRGHAVHALRFIVN